MGHHLPSDIITDMCIETARELAYLSVETEPQPVKPNSRLIFPNYRSQSGSGDRRDGDARISEQEARQVFCQKVTECNYELYYSVETPTTKRYRFQDGSALVFDSNDKRGRSAASDASLFALRNAKFWPSANIEFKAHNVTQAQITKDLLKLVSEKPSGLFFHLLSSVNSGTLKNPGSRDGVLDKYVKALNSVAGQVDDKPAGWYLVFAICIMSPGKVLLTRVMTNRDFKRHKKTKDFSSFFGDLSGTQKGVIYRDRATINGWTISAL